MKKAKKIIFLAIIIVLLFLLNSCFGINADIALNNNGSGTILVEYKISNSLDSLGRQDGNERWNTIPVGRADFERTVDRLPGMKLLSFSSRNDGKNLVIRAKMEFQNIEGLLAFMDAGGRRSSFSGDEKSGRIVLTLVDGHDSTQNIQNPSLLKLIAGISESYTVSMFMSFPSEGSLAITNNLGNPPALVPGGDINPKGRRVFFSFPLFELLSSTEGINAEFSW
jgi:hypothetical protein